MEANERTKAREQAKAYKKEMQNLMSKYPKDALKGLPLELDAQWKKGFVAFIAIVTININVAGKLTGLSNQISDKFNDACRDGHQIALTEEAKNELKITFREKNLLLSTSETLRPPLVHIKEIIMKEKELMDQDIYHYYVGANAELMALMDEQKRQAADVDSTIGECFADEIKKGAQIEPIEREALEGIDTRGDIKEILERIGKSMGLRL